MVALRAQCHPNFAFRVLDGVTDALADELALVWKRYAKAPDKKLTPAAKALKYRMLATFREV